MLSRFDRIPEYDGQTDIKTDGHNCYINIARQCADARKMIVGLSLIFVSVVTVIFAKYYRYYYLHCMHLYFCDF